MPPPPPDLGVDPDDDEGMPDDKDHQEAGVDQRPAPIGALVHGQLSDAKYKMELGNQLIALIVEAGIRIYYYIDIEADDRLLQMCIGMMCDMYSLMRHVVGVTIAFMRLMRTIARYRRG